MAADPSIILGVNPPTLDPLGMMGKVLALKDQQQQQQLNQQEMQVRQGELDDRAAARAGQKLLGQILQSGAFDADGLPTPDTSRRLVAVPGGAKLLEDLAGTQEKIATLKDRRTKLAQAEQEHQAAQHEHLFDLFDRVSGLPPEEQPAAFLTLALPAIKSGQVSPEEVFPHLGRVFPNGLDSPPDPAAMQKLTTLVHQTSKGYLAAQEKAREGVNVPASDRRINPQTGAMITPAQPIQRTQAELAADAATVGTDHQTPTAADSKAALALLAPPAATPKLGPFEDYVLQRFGPRPTAAEQIKARTEWARAEKPESSDPLMKVEHKDPDTGRTVIEWLPKSQLVGRTFQKGTSATTETRLASAEAVNQTGTDMIAKLSDPAFAKVVGPAMGRASSLRDFIGNPPPEFSELAGQIESYALANMGVHGMRSAQGAEQIKQLLDKKHTPESLISAIKGLQAFSTHFLENEGRSVTPAKTAGAPDLTGLKAGAVRRFTSGPHSGERWTVDAAGTAKRLD